MHTESLNDGTRPYVRQTGKKSAERRTLIVIVITMVTMAVEIAAGIAFARWLYWRRPPHGSHASALTISPLPTTTPAAMPRMAFNFGTGKVSSLAGLPAR